MLPANDNFDLFSPNELRFFKALDKKKKAARDGRTFLGKWIPKLIIEGRTEANRHALANDAGQLTTEAKEWVRCNRPCAWGL